MEPQLLLFAMLPVVAYAWLRRGDGGYPRAIAGAVIVAALECGLNSLRLARVEWLSLASLLLFLLLGGVTLLRRDERFVKLQPVALDLLLAGVFLHAWTVLEVPLFAVILEEHVGLLEIVPAYQRGYAELYLATLSRSVPWLFLVHAGVTAEAALRRSTAWWCVVRTLGFYALLGALFLAERWLRVTP